VFFVRIRVSVSEFQFPRKAQDHLMKQSFLNTAKHILSLEMDSKYQLTTRSSTKANPYSLLSSHDAKIHIYVLAFQS
jgi:hypothetical protein